MCCRRRRVSFQRPSLPPPELPQLPWQPPSDPLEAEWKVVERSISAEELARLREFADTVASLGLHSHAACASTPHTRRAATLLRYLCARDGDVREAAALLTEALDWRRDFDLDRKLKIFRAEMAAGVSPRAQMLQEYEYSAYLGRDRRGLPVWLHRFSQGDPGGLVREIGFESIALYFVRILEDNFAESQKLMLKTGCLVNSFVEIMDLGNYGLVPKWMPRAMASVGPLRKLAPVLDKVYPERVRACFLVRCPQAFSVVWSLVSSLVPPSTKNKVFIKGFEARTWITQLEELVHPEAIPLWLKVDDDANFPNARPWGGIVPKGAMESCR